MQQLNVTPSSTNTYLSGTFPLSIPTISSGDTFIVTVDIYSSLEVLYASTSFSQTVLLEPPGSVVLSASFIPTQSIPLPDNFFLMDSNGNCPNYDTTSSSFVQSQSQTVCSVFNASTDGGSNSIGAQGEILVTDNDDNTLYLSSGGGIPIDNVLLIPVSGGFNIQVQSSPLTYISWITSTTGSTSVLGISSSPTVWTIEQH